MDYASVLEAISKQENGAELVDAIKGEVNRKGQENKSLRDRLKAFGEQTPDSIAAAKAALEAITGSLDGLGIDTTKDIAEQLAALKNNQGQNGDLSKKVTDLTKQISSLQKERDSERQEKDRLALDNKRKTIESSVSSLFQQRVLNPMVSMRYHISQGDFDLDDTGAVVYKDSDGNAHPVNKGGFDAFLKVNPDAIKNSQSGGSGRKPEGGAAGDTGKKLTIEDIKAMTPRQVADRYEEVQATMKESAAAAA